MDTVYQLIILGADNPYRQDILDTFYVHIAELGIDAGNIAVITAADFSRYKQPSPTFCIYFGFEDRPFNNLDIVDKLQKDAKLILPVTDDITTVKTTIPGELTKLNVFELDGNDKIEALVAVIMEGLGLLRLSRRLFISYKRDDSRLVALQLFETLEAAGFDVFLDTHSIRPGEPFQDELWHRLVDTDVVVLLNTSDFLGSPWTKEELARASAMSVGILQLIWPDQTLPVTAKLTLPLRLKETDFGNNIYRYPDNYLADTALTRIVSTAESLRARSLAARQAFFFNEVKSIAANHSAPVIVQPAKYLMVQKRNGNYIVIVPAVGIPQAFTYYQIDQLTNTLMTGNVDRILLLYDHLYIREQWLAHLSWLDGYMTIKSMKISEIAGILPTLL